MYKVFISILVLLIIFYVLRRNQQKISDETFVSGGMGSRGRYNSGGAGHVTGYSGIRPSHQYVVGGAEMQSRPRPTKTFTNQRSTQGLRSLSKSLGSYPSVRPTTTPSFSSLNPSVRPTTTQSFSSLNPSVRPTTTQSFRPSTRPFSRPNTVEYVSQLGPEVSAISNNTSVPTDLTLVNTSGVIRPVQPAQAIRQVGPIIPIHSVQQVHPITPVQPIYYPSGVPGTVVVYENQAVPVDAVSYTGQIGFLTNYVDQMYLPLIRENSIIPGRYLFYTIVENTAVPVWADGVNCMDDQGCDHLQNLQQVYIPQFDRTFSVIFYNQ